MSIESVRTSARQKCGIAHYALLFGDSDESVNPSAHHFRSNTSTLVYLSTNASTTAPEPSFIDESSYYSWEESVCFSL